MNLLTRFASLSFLALAATGAPALAQDVHLLERGVELGLEARHDGTLGDFDYAAELANRPGGVIVTRTSGQRATTAILDPETGAELGVVAGRGTVSAYQAQLLRTWTTRDGTACFYVQPDLEGGLDLRRHDTRVGSERWLVHWQDPLGRWADFREFDAASDGSRLFVLCQLYPAGTKVHIAIAFDGETGAVLWQETLDLPGTPRVDSAPDGSRTFVSFLPSSTQEPSITTALDGATGAELWTTSAAEAPVSAPGAEAVVFEGRVAAKQLGLFAHATETGDLLWKTGLPDGEKARVESADGTRVFTLRGSLPARLHALDGTSGAVLWDVDSPFYSGRLALSADQREVIVLEVPYQAGTEPSPIRLLGLDADTGTQLFLHAPPELIGGVPHRLAVAQGSGGAEALVLKNSLVPNYPELVDAEVVAVDLKSGAATWRRILDAPLSAASFPRDIAVSPDGKAVFVATALAKDNELVRTAFQPYAGSGSLPFNEVTSPSYSEIVAFDASSGSELWTARRRRTAIAVKEGVDSWGADLVEVTPDGACVLAGIRDGTEFVVAAYDAAEGRELWSTSLPTQGESSERDSLVVSGDGALVFAGFLGYLPEYAHSVVALDATTGEVVWEAAAGTTALQSLLVASPDGEHMYAVDEDEAGAVIRAFDSATGSLAWIAGGAAQDPPSATPATVALGAAAGRRAVYVTGYRPGPPPDYVATPWLAAYDGSTGAELWSTGAAGEPGVFGGAIVLGAQGTVLVGGAQGYGDLSVSAYDARTGEWLWLVQLSDETFLANEGFELDADGTTLFVTGVGAPGAAAGGFATFALDAVSGEPLWQAGFAGEFGNDAAAATAFDPAHHRLLVAGRSDDAGARQDTVLLGYDVPTLVSDTDALSARVGGTLGLSLRAGSRFGGAAHLVLGTTAGTRPGIELGGARLPLNPSAYLSATLSPLSGSPLTGAAGILDELGRGAAQLIVPPEAAGDLAGLTLHHAYVLLASDPAGPRVSLVSNVVAVDLQR